VGNAESLQNPAYARKETMTPVATSLCSRDRAAPRSFGAAASPESSSKASLATAAVALAVDDDHIAVGKIGSSPPPALIGESAPTIPKRRCCRTSDSRQPDHQPCQGSLTPPPTQQQLPTPPPPHQRHPTLPSPLDLEEFLQRLDFALMECTSKARADERCLRWSEWLARSQPDARSVWCM
jgi:hypothetical protein